FAIVYACNGLVEFLHYFYRGLSRSDLESSLTLWQRGATLVCALAALAWRPDVTALAIAMLAPSIATLLVSLRIARRLAPQPGINPQSAIRNQSASRNPQAAMLRDVRPLRAGIGLSARYLRIGA